MLYIFSDGFIKNILKQTQHMLKRWYLWACSIASYFWNTLDSLLFHIGFQVVWRNWRSSWREQGRVEGPPPPSLAASTTKFSPLRDQGREKSKSFKSEVLVIFLVLFNTKVNMVELLVGRFRFPYFCLINLYFKGNNDLPVRVREILFVWMVINCWFAVYKQPRKPPW